MTAVQTAVYAVGGIMLYHAYNPQTILDFLDLKYNTSTTHHSVDVSVTRGFAATTVDFTTPDFVHIHVTNEQYGTNLASTLMETIRHTDKLIDSIPYVLDLLHGTQIRIRRMATSWTREPICEEYHNHRAGMPSIFLLARASLTDNGLVDAESMDYDIILIRSNITIGYSVPTMA